MVSSGYEDPRNDNYSEDQGSYRNRQIFHPATRSNPPRRDNVQPTTREDVYEDPRADTYSYSSVTKVFHKACTIREKSNPSIRERSGPPMRERSNPHMGERSCPPMIERSNPPVNERYDPPMRERPSPPMREKSSPHMRYIPPMIEGSSTSMIPRSNPPQRDNINSTMIGVYEDPRMEDYSDDREVYPVRERTTPTTRERSSPTMRVRPSPSVSDPENYPQEKRSYTSHEPAYTGHERPYTSHERPYTSHERYNPRVAEESSPPMRDNFNPNIRNCEYDDPRTQDYSLEIETYAMRKDAIRERYTPPMRETRPSSPCVRERPSPPMRDGGYEDPRKEDFYEDKVSYTSGERFNPSVKQKASPTVIGAPRPVLRENPAVKEIPRQPMKTSNESIKSCAKKSSHTSIKSQVPSQKGSCTSLGVNFKPGPNGGIQNENENCSGGSAVVDTIKQMQQEFTKSSEQMKKDIGEMRQVNEELKKEVADSNKEISEIMIGFLVLEIVIFLNICLILLIILF